MEAIKQIYAGHPTTERKQKRSVITVQQQTQLTQSIKGLPRQQTNSL
jgi:hypothetical protein